MTDVLTAAPAGAVTDRSGPAPRATVWRRRLGPAVAGQPKFPTQEQVDAAKAALVDGWSKAMTG